MIKENLPDDGYVLYNSDEYSEEWHNKYGYVHRLDGPARISYNGEKQWFVNGLLHREDGPAVERIDGTEMWYYNGNLHREDGPALVYYGGKYYHYHGIYISNFKNIFHEILFSNKDVKVKFLNNDT